MRRLILGHRVAALMSAVLISLSVSATAAQASTTSGFHCLSPTVCVFQAANWSGTVATFPTHTYPDQWVSITAGYNVTLPWGSFYDNSGSSVAFGDAETQQTYCYKPGSRINEPPQTNYRYIWIEYGNTNCSQTLPVVP